MKWIASAAFGLEGQTMRDLKRLGAANAQTMNVGGATFEGDSAINASAIFGGIDIFVPDGINVCLRSNSIFGGASDKLNRPHIEGAPTLYVNATCVFGGLELK